MEVDHASIVTLPVPIPHHIAHHNTSAHSKKQTKWPSLYVCECTCRTWLVYITLSVYDNTVGGMLHHSCNSTGWLLVTECNLESLVLTISSHYC